MANLVGYKIKKMSATRTLVLAVFHERMEFARGRSKTHVKTQKAGSFVSVRKAHEFLSRLENPKGK